MSRVFLETLHNDKDYEGLRYYSLQVPVAECGRCSNRAMIEGKRHPVSPAGQHHSGGCMRRQREGPIGESERADVRLTQHSHPSHYRLAGGDPTTSAHPSPHESTRPTMAGHAELAAQKGPAGFYLTLLILQAANWRLPKDLELCSIQSMTVGGCCGCFASSPSSGFPLVPWSLTATGSTKPTPFELWARVVAASYIFSGGILEPQRQVLSRPLNPESHWSLIARCRQASTLGDSTATPQHRTPTPLLPGYQKPVVRRQPGNKSSPIGADNAV
jgi:hypothetical protein